MLLIINAFLLAVDSNNKVLTTGFILSLQHCGGINVLLEELHFSRLIPATE